MAGACHASSSRLSRPSWSMQAKPPVLKDTDNLLPGFLWYLWAAAGKTHLRDVQVADSVIMINGRPKAWVFYSKKAGRVRTCAAQSYKSLASSINLVTLSAWLSERRPRSEGALSPCKFEYIAQYWGMQDCSSHVT